MFFQMTLSYSKFHSSCDVLQGLHKKNFITEMEL